MIRFKTVVNKFAKQGEKTGWTYIMIPADLATTINPGVKKSFRVKGSLDKYKFSGLNLLPMGEGNFILALNAEIRKNIRKKSGDEIIVQMELDTSQYQLNKQLMEVLETEPKAYAYFNTLPKSHQNYFSKWIESAKTINTQQDRIAETVNAMLNKQNYAEMLRSRR